MLRFALAILWLGLLPQLPDTARAQAADPDAERGGAQAVAVLQHQRASMTTLTAWGTASMGAGAAWMISERHEPFGFWGGVQHLSWGLTNVLIGASSLHRANHTRVHALRPADYWPARARRMRRVYWINAGLDVLYVASGALLLGLSAREAARGSGAAIVAQGGALFVFDVIAALTGAHLLRPRAAR